MTRKHDHDQDQDHDHDNDNGGTKREDKAVAPAPAGGALASLTNLAAALNKVDTGVGHSTKPMMLYKSRGNTWVYGRQEVVPEENGRWGVNPTTFERGFVAFQGRKKLGERMLSVAKPEIDPAELPDVGAIWQKQMSVEMRCLDGADAGTEVVFKTNTAGGLSAILDLIGQVRDRLNFNQHGDNIVPIVRLEKGGYDHGEYGWTGTPLLTVTGWMSLSNPAPAPTSPPPTPQPAAATASPPPRRRRVG
jgi:hypothetical protein